MRAHASSGVAQSSSRNIAAPKRARQPASAATLFFVFASLAGTCGALSGVVGKLAVAASGVPELVAAASKSFGLTGDAAAMVTAAVPWIMRVLLFALNGFLTVQMWRFHLKALSLGPTPVCQVLNTGTNFAVSALAGLMVFGESVNYTWMCGALFVVLGLALVVTDPKTAASLG